MLILHSIIYTRADIYFITNPILFGYCSKLLIADCLEQTNIMCIEDCIMARYIRIDDHKCLFIKQMG